MIRRALIAVAALGISMLLPACSANDPCAQASNPAECRQWTDAGGDINDYLVGGMVGYMLANRGGQQVIVQNPNYQGSYRQLRRPLLSESAQVRQLKAKVERQKVELRRQQEANRRYKAEKRRSSWGSSSRKSSWGSSSRFGSSRRRR